MVDGNGTLWHGPSLKAMVRGLARLMADYTGLDGGQVYERLIGPVEALTVPARNYPWAVASIARRVCLDAGASGCGDLASRVAVAVEAFALHAAIASDEAPFAVDVLESLREDGWRIVVVTKLHSFIASRIVEALGLQHTVAGLATPDTSRFRARRIGEPPFKPWRPPFIKAARIARAKLSEAVMVGDDPETDCLGALLAGAEKCIVVGRNGLGHGRVARDWREVGEILGA